VVQLVGAAVAAALAIGTWMLCDHLPLAGVMKQEVQLFCTALVLAGVFFAFFVLAGDRTEPFAAQLAAYCRRPRRYRPPVLIVPAEERHDA
jgi:hypothetical protein